MNVTLPSKIKNDRRLILKTTLKITIPTDGTTLFNVLIRTNSTTEKCLLIDLNAAIETYNDGIIDDIIWIHRKCNLAGTITTPTILTELLQAVDEWNTHYEVQQPIKRSPTTAEQENKKFECGNKDISIEK